MGIATSKSSALSIFTPLIFEIQLINGALFLNITAVFYYFLALSELVTVIILFTTIYASLKSHKSDLSIEVLILIYFFGL